MNRARLAQRKGINPFVTGWNRQFKLLTQATAVEDRLPMVSSFSRKDCLAALRLPREDVQDTVRKALARRLRVHHGEQACRHCGCTWTEPCDGGCGWVSLDECSACKGVPF